MAAKKTTAAAVLIAAAVGVAGGRASTPQPQSTQGAAGTVTRDPLGGWHYAATPVRVCLAKDGAATRASVRPEIVTGAGLRVSVPELRAHGAAWLSCRTATAPTVPPAQDVCFTRVDGGAIEVDIEGRPFDRLQNWPTCILAIFQTTIDSSPLSLSGQPTERPR